MYHLSCSHTCIKRLGRITEKYTSIAQENMKWQIRSFCARKKEKVVNSMLYNVVFTASQHQQNAFQRELLGFSPYVPLKGRRLEGKYILFSERIMCLDKPALHFMVLNPNPKEEVHVFEAKHIEGVRVGYHMKEVEGTGSFHYEPMIGTRYSFLQKANVDILVITRKASPRRIFANLKIPGS